MDSNDPKAGAAPSSRSKTLRLRLALGAGFIIVGVTGVVIGRVSTRGSPAEAASPPEGGAGIPELAAPTAQTFNITEDPNVHVGIPLREMDREIFNMISSGRLQRERMRDVFPDKPYRVTFMGSVAEKRIGAVLIDMNRTGKIDENWRIAKGEVRRMVPEDPNAGGKQVTYTLGFGRWQLR